LSESVLVLREKRTENPFRGKEIKNQKSCGAQYSENEISIPILRGVSPDILVESWV
jgi:hypothetical protein